MTHANETRRGVLSRTSFQTIMQSPKLAETCSAGELTTVHV